MFTKRKCLKRNARGLCVVSPRGTRLPWQGLTHKPHTHTHTHTHTHEYAHSHTDKHTKHTNTPTGTQTIIKRT